ASPTASSTTPEPYISAVSMWVMPRSKPRRSTFTTTAMSSSSRYHVPWPITGTSRSVGPNRRCSIVHPSDKVRSHRSLRGSLLEFPGIAKAVTGIGQGAQPFPGNLLPAFLTAAKCPLLDALQGIDDLGQELDLVLQHPEGYLFIVEGAARV